MPCFIKRPLLWAPGTDPIRRRRCYGLAYASQQENPMWRGVSRAQKIRMRLGGSARLAEPFPDEPKGMHWRTYSRLRDRAQASENLSNISLMQWANRLKNSLKLPFLIGSWRRAQPSAGPHTVQRRLANATTRDLARRFRGERRGSRAGLCRNGRRDPRREGGRAWWQWGFPRQLSAKLPVAPD